MSAPNPSNIFSGKSPVQAWRIVRREIALRQDKAFGHAGYSFLYSGPDVAVSPKRDFYIPFAPRITNQERTAREVQEGLGSGIPAAWLDGSPIGKFLFGENELYVGIQEYFAAAGIVDDAKRWAGGDYVMSRVSRAYIKSAFGYAATAVCGASHNRIFYRYELPALVSNDKIKAANQLPREMVRDFYAINKDEAFQLICWAELLLSKSRMEANDNEDTRRDFFQRQYFLNNERKLMQETVTPLSSKGESKREQKRNDIFSRHASQICSSALKNLLTDIRPLCPSVVSFQSRARKASLAA